MACLILQDRQKPHTIQDDIESFVYVVLYHSIRYLSHNKSEDLELILDEFFDDKKFNRGGLRVGGGHKLTWFRLRGDVYPFDGFEVTNHAPLNDWITGSFDVVGEWLEVVGRSRRLAPSPDAVLRTLQLYSHQPIADLFARCLSHQGWPTNDKAVDRMRPRVTGNTVENARNAVQSSIGSALTSSSPKRSLASEELDEGYEGSGSGSKPKKQRKARSKASGSSRSFHNSMTMDDDDDV